VFGQLIVTERTEKLFDCCTGHIRQTDEGRIQIVVRVWGALRVMTPDGYPLYEESRSCPGAYVVTCHSGVTLAAAHAFRIAPWIDGAPAPEELNAFQRDRFFGADAQTPVLDHHHAH
jgi:glycine/D-amino acid oxidase-like deaminating enzyme